MNEVSPEQAEIIIKELLDSTESIKLEFKRIGTVKHARLYEVICAFANTVGGLLVIGIGDAKVLKTGENPQSRLYGIENAEGFDNFQKELLHCFAPSITKLQWTRVLCTLKTGLPGYVVLLQVDKSEQVHSIVGNGTWTRMNASNRELSAPEIVNLAYQRGVKSAETLRMPVPLSLLSSQAWRSYCATRGLVDLDINRQLPKLGLATEGADGLQPLLAAVLLFADEPGALLAGQGMRADIRIFHYKGRAVQRGAVPNLLMTPKTITGPVVSQIALAQAYVLERLAQGLKMEGSGFKTRYRYPERVIKEAITNAVVHRDYRLNRDIHVRIFDDRVEIESPGLLPGNLTTATIEKSGSMPRNNLLVRHLREFPNPPNVDAGEGIPMMFAQMAEANLYKPGYHEQLDKAVPTLRVILLNEEQPPLWVQVSDWIDQNGPIVNAKLREISGLDTLAASRQLRQWVMRGVLVALPAASPQKARYTKPELAEQVNLSLSLSLGFDNEA